MTTPAAPQSATPPTTGPADGQPAAPATTPPVPGPPPNAQPQGNRDMAVAPAGEPAATAADAPKTFGVEDVNRIVQERLAADRIAQNKKFAEALGIVDPSAPVDPAKALEAEQGKTKAAYSLALSATAESIALAAGIKPERVETFVALANASGVLKDVDLTDPNAKAALRTALETEAAKYPEWKGSALPAASGGDRQAPNGKPTFTRAQLAAMPQSELRARSAELLEAQREGRIVG
ncbi:hypothetical protein [Saccharothrix stipae]